jgi:hypothetical protein
LKATKLLSTLLAIKTIQVYDFNEDFSFFFYYIYIQASFLLLSSFFFFLHFSLQQARNHNLSKKTKTKEDYELGLANNLSFKPLTVCLRNYRDTKNKKDSGLCAGVSSAMHISFMFIYLFIFIYEVVFVFSN